MERTTRDGNLRGGIHQTDKPIILVVVWGPCNGKNTKIGRIRQGGAVRTGLSPTPAHARRTR